MIDDIQEIIQFVTKRMEHIDKAANDIPTNSQEFLDCEKAVVELKAAICDLESAVGHIAKSLVDRVIWRIGHAGEDWKR